MAGTPRCNVQIAAGPSSCLNSIDSVRSTVYLVYDNAKTEARTHRCSLLNHSPRPFQNVLGRWKYPWALLGWLGSTHLAAGCSVMPPLYPFGLPQILLHEKAKVHHARFQWSRWAGSQSCSLVVKVAQLGRDLRGQCCAPGSIAEPRLFFLRCRRICRSRPNPGEGCGNMASGASPGCDSPAPSRTHGLSTDEGV